jgi:aminoglycoside phosphotransferase (APT) family kinase protein
VGAETSSEVKIADGSELPPLLATTNLTAVRDAVLAEGRGVDVTGAWRSDDDLENLVLRTTDGWIVRFPRCPEPGFAREVGVLGRLAGRLTVPIPEVAWIGTRCRMMAYRAMVGAAFDASAYSQADARHRNRLAASLARFLVVMHTALSSDEIAQIGVPTVDGDAQHALVVDRIDRVPPALRSRAMDVADHFRESWLEEPRPVGGALLHNAFRPSKMVLTDGVGELAGIWGFSRVRVGPPSLDLRYLASYPAEASAGLRRDLMQRVADQYARTGIRLDVDAARAAMAMEDLIRAIDSGDFHRFEPDDGMWSSSREDQA